jgi:hypothetical protein
MLPDNGFVSKPKHVVINYLIKKILVCLSTEVYIDLLNLCYVLKNWTNIPVSFEMKPQH